MQKDFESLIKRLELTLESPEFKNPDCRTKAELKNHQSYIDGFSMALEIVKMHAEKENNAY